ncbi:adenylosuccinate lyase [Porphyromonas endodontalis]|jgi:adenylosuccinate lyase|uniref:adenylosuccinate lyase n=1 Tax=Porphyromonas endodontalis TaxID=28124 RepID=UPI0028EA51E4|nr:adenylosuccinate lyase [Porphyromonas endodontalis]
MSLDSLLALTPLDGRYQSKTQDLRSFFSEYALIRYRIWVEIEYFLALSDTLPQLQNKIDSATKEQLRNLYRTLTPEEAAKVKEIESVTNHDVKAVEYYIKTAFDALNLSWAKEFVHFGLTSQDINNTAFPMMLRGALKEVFEPALSRVLELLRKYTHEWAEIPMLARTHGQPASPTRLGKEFGVYVYRLEEQLKLYHAIPFGAKFGGATGNFNAHHVAYPEIDWKQFGNHFVASLGLEREQITTQISNYDHLAALLESIARINTILVDLARDVWMYISMGYFKQRIKAGEVGSSAMPHKVNPIDFENAEGNLMLSSSIALFLASKLPISRLQRDLTDSTVIRNEGLPLGYTLIALKSLEKGLGKILLNEDAIAHDLQSNYEVVAEALQTILRREGYPNPYETLKQLTRTGEAMTAESIHRFIDTLDVAPSIKEEMRAISPQTYVGI